MPDNQEDDNVSEPEAVQPTTESSELGTSARTPVRVWPAYIAVVIVVVGLVLQQTPSIQNGTRFFVFQMLAPLVGFLIFAIWALLLSRANWKERIGLIACFVLPAIAAGYFTHPKTAVMLWIYGVPGVLIVTTFVYRWLAAAPSARRMTGVGIAASILWSIFPFFRVDGINGSYRPELSMRWSPEFDGTLESGEVQVASVVAEPFAPEPTATDWPRFRGRDQDGRVVGFATPLNWEDRPLEPKWKIDIGSGWGSFAAVDYRLFTQEQRGENECITCLNAETGETIWRSVDKTRFDETVSGPGPRSTPTYDAGVLYTYGSYAKLAALDAATGDVLWSRDLTEEFGAKLPMWGFSNSPLIVDTDAGKLVVIQAGGLAEHGLCAFNADDGKLVWEIPSKGENYSSAQHAEIDGESFVLFLSETGLLGLNPSSGTTVWEYTPEHWVKAAMVQPRQIAENDILVPIGDADHMTRITVRREDDAWAVEELWSSRHLKPSFNDFVVHDGYAYGFDQNILACINLENGKREWKRGRYGFGQLIVLADAGQLIVASEQGELVLLNATPEGHEELGTIKALEGKTWNHPIVANKHLFHRNGTAAVCYALPTGDPKRESITDSEESTTTENAAKRDTMAAQFAASTSRTETAE